MTLRSGIEESRQILRKGMFPSKKREPKHKFSSSQLKLDDNSQLAVIGGGPAGSFFSYFLLDMAERVGITIQIDIFESRDFSSPAPMGCNMCGGIISESLVQTLATEGINLPSTVVQRGIESYTLHMDVGSVVIKTPLHEKRIGAVYRGAGPRDIKEKRWDSFDGFLQKLTKEKGAQIIQGRVNNINWEGGRPQVKTREGLEKAYDLLAVAVGVNSPTVKLFSETDYEAPGTTKTFICEYYLGKELVDNSLGSSMHTFLLNIPRLEFAAFIPKGDYVTVCMLGREIDKELVLSFLESPEVKDCMPPTWILTQNACQCYPRINIKGSDKPFSERMLFIGDCGVSRLYKDGIGAAYHTAKAAATTVIFEGISADNFKKHFWPACRRVEHDNRIGKMIFFAVGKLQKFRFARRAILRMVTMEQKWNHGQKRMSMALWDMFTGSAPYKEVFLRMLHPLFIARFLWNMIVAVWPLKRKSEQKGDPMSTGDLGKVYQDGEVIIRQGEAGDCMYEILNGKVEVIQEKEDKNIRLAVLSKGDFFGEMAIFEREVRSATVRALGEARALTIDKRIFLRRIIQDPSLAFRIVERMSKRIRELNAEIVRLKTET